MDESSSGAAPLDRLRRAAALLEVIGVFVAGHVLATVVTSVVGLPSLSALLDREAAATTPDFLGLSGVALAALGIQYLCLLGLAWLIGRWHRRRPLASYGLTLGSAPLGEQVLSGIVLFAALALPVKLLLLAHRFFDLGEGPRLWKLLEGEWSPAFWLFAAVISFAFVPVVEELFYRGYVQRRLGEDWGASIAILTAAAFFVLVHTQYHHASVLSFGMALTLLPVALGLGYLYYRTRSLVAPVTLHVLINIPTRGLWDYVLLGLMLLVLLLFRRQAAELLGDLWRTLAGARPAARALTAVGVAALLALSFSLAPALALMAGGGALLAALVLEEQGRRRRAASEAEEP